MLGRIALLVIGRAGAALAASPLRENESLKEYMRKAFRGVAFLFAGSALVGAMLSFGLYLGYEQMLLAGYTKGNAMAVIFGTTLALALICFLLADRYIAGRMDEKQSNASLLDEKLDMIRDIAGDTINGFLEGFSEGRQSGRSSGSPKGKATRRDNVSHIRKNKR